MARNQDLPKPASLVLKKTDLLDDLVIVDTDPAARQRVLAMETNFRSAIAGMISALPVADSKFERFKTSPFVLLPYACRHGYGRISELEDDIIPAKVFSSMETAAGRMVEAVTLPVYGWQQVASEMHSAKSHLDGQRIGAVPPEVATLKSGPRCLNDEMSENFADAILNYAAEWADGSSSITFTYGVLYGTARQSNKKDWHILRKLAEKGAATGATVTDPPVRKWSCSLEQDHLAVRAQVLIGLDWWTHLGGPTCAMEVWIALIRACIQPGVADANGHPYAIRDLEAIVDCSSVPAGFNVSLLQNSQIPWLFFTARHFCDQLA